MGPGGTTTSVQVYLSALKKLYNKDIKVQGSRWSSFINLPCRIKKKSPYLQPNVLLNII